MPRILKHSGVRITVGELVRLTGLKQSTVSMRLRSGWSVERIVSTPLVSVHDRWRFRQTDSRSGRYSWLTNDDAGDRLARRMLMAAAKRGEPEAVEALRRLGLLCWATAERVIV